MFRLTNPIQHYPWGSPRDIPAFCGFAADGQPQAEMWIGAHPSAPSVATPATVVIDPDLSGPIRLDHAISADPAGLLGAEVAERFGERLPYLVKLLAAAKPLSLQAHPSSEYARLAHAREVAAGTPAAERNYPDAFHKPEMLVALVPTLALAGFRHPDDAAHGLERIGGAAVADVVGALRGPGTDAARVRAGFEAALALPVEAVARVIAELRTMPLEFIFDGVLAEDIARILIEHYTDAGVVASFLLNAVDLAPGEGLYVDAGVVHAYVDGFGLEVMAASDNVLRAGLTTKRVDIDELMAIVDFEPAPAHIVRPTAQWAGVRSVEEHYATPAADFALTVLNVSSVTQEVSSSVSAGPRVVICLDGVVQVEDSFGRIALARGESALVADSAGSVRLAGTGRAAVVGVGA